jgi:hypothetical protein
VPAFEALAIVDGGLKWVGPMSFFIAAVVALFDTAAAAFL